MTLSWIAWAWIPLTLWAALAQTARNAAQRSLTAGLGTLAATLVRFLYGLPLATAWVAGLTWAGAGGIPQFNGMYAAWLAMGALTQVGATAFLLLAMKERNFVLAVAYSKTEVLQVALFSAVLLHELPGPLALGAMAAATVGVVLLSLPPGGGWRALRAGPGAVDGQGSGRLVVYGLASGACFALASVGFRGASLALAEANAGVAPWVAGAWGVFWAQLLQSVVLGGWLLARQPGVAGAIARAWRMSVVAGSMGAVASIAWFTAYAMRPASDVRTLGLVEVLFSYLVSRRVFRESLTRTEGVGLALVVAGLVGVCAQW
ncbi:EamA family transporter [Acidovorax sp. A79]|uniref:EamA/RhaT family transporter n=1 Tax=Acidovorax sp. A79 TaxID=3056107 RepID=UPI0034E8E10D